MRARLSLLLLTLLLPLEGAQAGSETEPEFSDPAGDQDPNLPLTRHTDLLAGWLHDETPDSFSATLKVTLLEATSQGIYDFVWVVFRNGTEELGWWGVRVRLNVTGPTWKILHADPGEERLSNFSEMGNIEGEVRRGEPGYFTWRIPKAQFPSLNREDYFSFNAFSYQENPLKSLFPGELQQHDQARNEQGEYHVGVAPHVNLGGFPPPQRTPDLTDPAEDVEKSFLDLTGLWFDASPETVQGTLGLRGFQRSDFSDCEWFAILDLNDVQASKSRLQFRITLLLGPDRLVPLDWVSHANYEPIEAEGSIQEGTPGFVRFEAPASSWKGPSNLQNLFVRGQVACADQPQDRDLIEQAPPSKPTPVPSGWVWLALALSLSLFARRKL